MEAANRNQIKKARKRYLDILRLEQKQAAGEQLNTEQKAKVGRKQEVAEQLTALGVELPELASSATCFAAAGGPGAGPSGFGGGGVLRVRPGHEGSAPAPYSTAIPKADLFGAVAGARPFRADDYKVSRADQQAAQAPPLQTFVVKVQVPLAPGSAAADLPMLLYNQARSFQCYLRESSGADAARLVQLVRTRGVRGQKGYFTAWMEGEELVLREDMLPMQAW